MISDVDVFIGNYTMIDPEIYQLWVDGFSVPEIVTILQQRGVLQETGGTIDLLISDVNDHYRRYQLMEKLLQKPTKMTEQLTFQIEPQTQKALIERYYDFDDSVVREMLGKKLSSRSRKDLDEVSDKTGVCLKSCRRQFDNVKRVYKAVEDMPGSVVQNIQNHILLSEDLAKKYGAIVFIATNRFEISKRKLQYLTFSDFFHCAHAIMGSWTYQEGTGGNDTDLDREFLINLRELKALLEKEKEHKSLVCGKVKPKLSDKIQAEVESSFKLYSRTLINIAAGLNHNKELRDFFIDVVERCIDPCRQAHWTTEELSVFLESYTDAALEMGLDLFQSEPEMKSVWERYMTTVTTCLLKMYHC